MKLTKKQVIEEHEEFMKELDRLKIKDINYLDAIHHKQEVFERLGSIIEHPEKVWVERTECIVIDCLGRKMNLGLIPIPEDEYEQEFITLADIAKLEPNGCYRAICESSLGGVIYRYNNNRNKEWQLVGIMYGYA